MKRWYHGVVVRKALNGQGEVVRRNRQVADVYATEATAAAFVLRRCPDPWQGMDGEVRTEVNVSQRDDSFLDGR